MTVMESVSQQRTLMESPDGARYFLEDQDRGAAPNPGDRVIAVEMTRTRALEESIEPQEGQPNESRRPDLIDGPDVSEDPDNMLPELTLRFSYHPPVGGQAARYEEIRGAAFNFAWLIARSTPISREQSLAFTALEEAVMWANAAIARRSKQ